MRKNFECGEDNGKECRECWCYKMCSQCVAKAGENGKIEAANRLKWCKQSRENAEEYIKIILS